MEFEGHVLVIGPKQTVTSKDGERQRPKQQMVVEEKDGGEYPDRIAFTLFGDKHQGKFDDLEKGDEVRVSYNMNTRIPEEVTDKTNFFTNINAWRVEKLSPTNVVPNNASDADVASKAEPKTQTKDDNEDLPF